MSDNRIVIQRIENGYAVRESGFLPGSLLTAYEFYFIQKGMRYLLCVDRVLENSVRFGSQRRDVAALIDDIAVDEFYAKLRLLELARKKAEKMFGSRTEQGYVLEEFIEQ